MTALLSGNLHRVVILDVSGLYIQIYDQGYFTSEEIEKMSIRFKDPNHWRFLTL